MQVPPAAASTWFARLWPQLLATQGVEHMAIGGDRGLLVIEKVGETSRLHSDSMFVISPSLCGCTGSKSMLLMQPQKQQTVQPQAEVLEVHLSSPLHKLMLPQQQQGLLVKTTQL
jgi:hypothetical protein